MDHLLYRLALCLGLLSRLAYGGPQTLHPSVFNHGFVNASGRIETDAERLDYQVIAVFPALCFGPTLEEAYRRLGVVPGTEGLLDQASMEYRKIALLAVLDNLERQGFPYDKMPERMKQEYDALLIDSAIVIVAGPNTGNHTPILGVASVSYDWGNGTAGERRLGIRVPRAVPAAEFLDFNVRDGHGPLAISEDYSLLLSTKLWFLGGNHNVSEIKTLALSLDPEDLKAQALRLSISTEEVRAQILAILTHVISSYMLTGKDILAEPFQKLVPTPEMLDKRMRFLQPRIERASSGIPRRQRALESAMREFALRPPAQEFSLINQIFAYTGALDPRTGRDLIAAMEHVLRRRFPFPEKLLGFSDPDVPAMTLSVVQGNRTEFDSGKFLRNYSTLPVFSVPTQPHLIHPIAGDLWYGPEGGFGIGPPRLSTTFDCERYLSEYMQTFALPETEPNG